MEVQKGTLSNKSYGVQLVKMKANHQKEADKIHGLLHGQRSNLQLDSFTNRKGANFLSQKKKEKKAIWKSQYEGLLMHSIHVHYKR